MFTGIISDTASVRVAATSEKGMTLTFDRPASWSDLKEGESINTNGICLTVATIRNNEYDCVVIPETLQRTSFGTTVPKTVNLERALKLSDRLDGHLVQGHVDGIGKVMGLDDSDGRRLTITLDPAARELVVMKGSITIDGISLTVAAVGDNNFQVALIPHTLEHTTIESLQLDDAVNLEFDVIGKYVINALEKTTTSK